jgi:phosphate starvation-inducible PhoH-like protein
MKMTINSFLLIFLTNTVSRPIKSFLTMKNKSLNMYSPKTPNQIIYNNILNKDSEYLLSVIGPAGTGKTLLACVKGIEKLKENKIEKIIITRPIVSVEEEEIGFLPGNIDRKMDPWVRPIHDVFLDFYSKKEINELMSNNIIEISPLGFMRGRTFKNSLIIADEMQNSTPNQMLMLLTRIGIGSKIIITGDLEQSDLTVDNGLKDLVSKLENNNISENFYLVKMDESDVLRSQLVTDVLKLYKPIHTSNKLVSSELPFEKSCNTPLNTIDITQNGNRDAALIPIKDLKSNYKSL